MNTTAFGLFLLLVVSAFSEPALRATAQEEQSKQEVEGFLKDVQNELTNAQGLEQYNLYMRVWMEGLVVALTGIVTILTGIQAFGGNQFNAPGIKVATLIASTFATTCAIIPKNFPLSDEQYKYGSAVWRLLEVKYDLLYGHKSVEQVLPTFYAIERDIHAQPLSTSQPSPTPTATVSSPVKVSSTLTPTLPSSTPNDSSPMPTPMISSPMPTPMISSPMPTPMISSPAPTSAESSPSPSVSP